MKNLFWLRLIPVCIFIGLPLSGKAMRCSKNGGDICLCSAPTFAITTASTLASMGATLLSEFSSQEIAYLYVTTIATMTAGGTYAFHKAIAARIFPAGTKDQEKEIWQKRAALDSAFAIALTAAFHGAYLYYLTENEAAPKEQTRITDSCSAHNTEAFETESEFHEKEGYCTAHGEF